MRSSFPGLLLACCSGADNASPGSAMRGRRAILLVLAANGWVACNGSGAIKVNPDAMSATGGRSASGGRDGIGGGGTGTGGSGTGGAGGEMNGGTGGRAGSGGVGSGGRGSGGVGSGGGTVSGGAGGGQSNPCVGTCQLGTYCTGCDGGTRKLSCTCFMDDKAIGRWSCTSQGPCGSSGCGPADSACDPKFNSTCESCDGAGSPRRCTCAASGDRGTWACSSSTGACGIACGDRRCLPGELCINFGQYPGTFVDGGVGQPTLRPTCVVVPDACKSQQPTCTSCIVPVYGCSLPGVCRDLGQQTFDCILGGA